MILTKFRAWAQTASPDTRAEGASALARAYLHGRSNEAQRRDAACILTSFLDDPSPLVRRALAEALAGAGAAPHHIILALADDQAPIAAIVLAASPVLTDAELIDCATTAGDIAQAAIAGRSRLSGPVAAALAEVAAPAALVALARNLAAPLPPICIQRIIARHGDDAELRDALLARPDLTATARVDLVAATMRAVSSLITERNWMSEERLKRLNRETKDKAAITVAASSRGWSDALEIAGHLREAGELTLGFAFRAILSGKLELFKATLSVLTDVPIARVDSIVDRFDGSAFASLYRKADLPPALLDAVRIALMAAREADWSMRGPGLSCRVIERVLTGCEAINTGELDKLMVLLRRFESEAAREEIRAVPTMAPAHALRFDHKGFDAPLMLTDFDIDMPRALSDRSMTRRREPTIEAELCAA